MIPHNRLTFDEKEVKAVQKVIRSGYWAGGKEVEALEEKITATTSRKYAIGVSSGLSALRLALLALGVGKNDEVIIPAYSCVAIPNAVLACGAIPVPVDVIYNNWNIDPGNVRQKISSKTKAIIAVHTFGLNADIKKLNTFKIPVIEDCAHALGPIGNKYIYGKQGLISIGSFYATKLIGGGEGGVVITDNKTISDFIYDHRDYTDKKPSGLRLNEKMSNIDASLSLSQLNRIEYLVKQRQKIADFYNEEFSALKNRYSDLEIPDFKNRIWYRYVVCCKNINASEIINELELNGIRAAMPVENWMEGKEKANYPNSMFAAENLVSLPIYPTLDKNEKKSVVNALKRTLQKVYI